jgi:hypothetical protein
VRKLILFLFIWAFTFLVSTKHVLAQTFTFGAAGDFANGSNFTATVAQIKAANPAFTIALGDFAYTPAEQSWCGVWKANYNNILLISGNHDTGDASGGLIDTYAQYCPYTLSTPLTGTYAKEYYFDYPAGTPIARFILISPGLSGPGFSGRDTSYRIGSTSYNFVTNAIDSARAAGIKWIIVAEHKNYITAGEKPNELGPDLVNMLITKRVDLLLQGHEHIYERSKQLTCARLNSYDATCVADSDDSMVKGAGTIIHIIGTGGQGLRSVSTGDSEYPYFVKTDATTYGFGKFTVTPTSLSYQFVRSAGGNLADSFTIGGGVSNPTPTGNTSLSAVDVNNDRAINIIDIGIIVDNYGRNPIPNTRADVNHDGSVNIIDIGMVVDHYGQTY